MAAEDWSENVYIVHLSDDPAFSDELDQLERRCEENPRHIVLDLSSVTFVNSSNLSQLIRIRRLLGGTRCRVILCGVKPEVWKAFTVSGLDQLFTRADSVPLALAGLQISETSASDSA